MFKYSMLVILFFSHTLLFSWDQYEQEQLVLLSLAPGIGDQFAENCEEQKLPSYLKKIADKYPDLKVKIIAIDPRFSPDTTSPEYDFLKGWENIGLVFRKKNIEIQFFSEYIPEEIDEKYTQKVENYISKVIENGGVIFIGHHGQAYGAFEPFRTAYNNLKSDRVHMYICCGSLPPFSSPKVYHETTCSSDELQALHDILAPHLVNFFELDKAEYYLKYDENGVAWWKTITSNDAQVKVQCYKLLKTILKDVNTSFRFYQDMLNLPYDIIRSADGSLHLIYDEKTTQDN